MTTNKSYRLISWGLLVFPLLLMSGKMITGYLNLDRLMPKTRFSVNMATRIDSLQKDQEVFVKMFLPKNSQHQQIQQIVSKTGGLDFYKEQLPGVGQRGIWQGQSSEAQLLSYAFDYEGQALRYKIPRRLEQPTILDEDLQAYLAPEEYIQSDHFLIKNRAEQVIADATFFSEKVQALYDYVKSLRSIQTSELTDALTAMQKHAASCNGKSRLLVALSRAVGIPARVVGGIILENAQKRTSHLWAELWIGSQWVPFDALNDHYAFLPANYMQLYQGDYFLISRSTDISFDYYFTIEEERYYQGEENSWLTLWALQSGGNIPMSLLKVLLLLPLCALIVGICRNVIGVKTIGVFLPAIIAVSLEGVGLGFGLFAFVLVVAVVSLIHFPLERWGILHTPKLIIMLTGVVICLLTLSQIGIKNEIHLLQSTIFFPIIVLTIAAEKFAKTINEEGYEEAMKLQGQTLFLTTICYLVFKPDFTIGFFLIFPEAYLMIIAILLFLGRWIGLRTTEYFRFAALAKT